MEKCLAYETMSKVIRDNRKFASSRIRDEDAPSPDLPFLSSGKKRALCIPLQATATTSGKERSNAPACVAALKSAKMTNSASEILENMIATAKPLSHMQKSLQTLVDAQRLLRRQGVVMDYSVRPEDVLGTSSSINHQEEQHQHHHELEELVGSSLTAASVRDAVDTIKCEQIGKEKSRRRRRHARSRRETEHDDDDDDDSSDKEEDVAAIASSGGSNNSSKTTAEGSYIKREDKVVVKTEKDVHQRHEREEKKKRHRDSGDSSSSRRRKRRRHKEMKMEQEEEQHQEQEESSGKVYEKRAREKAVQDQKTNAYLGDLLLSKKQVTEKYLEKSTGKRVHVAAEKHAKITDSGAMTTTAVVVAAAQPRKQKQKQLQTQTPPTAPEDAEKSVKTKASTDKQQHTVSVKQEGDKKHNKKDQEEHRRRQKKRKRSEADQDQVRDDDDEQEKQQQQQQQQENYVFQEIVAGFAELEREMLEYARWKYLSEEEDARGVQLLRKLHVAPSCRGRSEFQTQRGQGYFDSLFVAARAQTPAMKEARERVDAYHSRFASLFRLCLESVAGMPEPQKSNITRAFRLLTGAGEFQILSAEEEQQQQKLEPPVVTKPTARHPKGTSSTATQNKKKKLPATCSISGRKLTRLTRMSLHIRSYIVSKQLWHKEHLYIHRDYCDIFESWYALFHFPQSLSAAIREQHPLFVATAATADEAASRSELLRAHKDYCKRVEHMQRNFETQYASFVDVCFPELRKTFSP